MKFKIISLFIFLGFLSTVVLAGQAQTDNTKTNEASLSVANTEVGEEVYKPDVPNSATSTATATATTTETATATTKATATEENMHSDDKEEVTDTNTPINMSKYPRNKVTEKLVVPYIDEKHSGIYWFAGVFILLLIVIFVFT